MSGVSPPQQYDVTNFLVPAGGGCHAIGFTGGYTGTPFPIDWRQFKIDNFPFRPQGVYIDNIDGTQPVTLRILPLGYRIICPAGASIARSFPAPMMQTCTLTGDPSAITTQVIFVDYPVFNEG